MPVRDPLTTWDGPFPYDTLARFGITPDSTIRDLLDASFDLMARGQMTPEVRVAWDQLRKPGRRIAVDFFLYQIDLARELARRPESTGHELDPPARRGASPAVPEPAIDVAVVFDC